MTRRNRMMDEMASDVVVPSNNAAHENTFYDSVTHFTTIL